MTKEVIINIWSFTFLGWTVWYPYQCWPQIHNNTQSDTLLSPFNHLYTQLFCRLTVTSTMASPIFDFKWLQRIAWADVVQALHHWPLTLSSVVISVCLNECLSTVFYSIALCASCLRPALSVHSAVDVWLLVVSDECPPNTRWNSSLLMVFELAWWIFGLIQQQCLLSGTRSTVFEEPA